MGGPCCAHAHQTSPFSFTWLKSLVVHQEPCGASRAVSRIRSPQDVVGGQPTPTAGGRAGRPDNLGGGALSRGGVAESDNHLRVQKCPLCEARFFYDSASPPRINMISSPDSRRWVDKARQVFYGTCHQNSLAAEYMRDSKNLRNYITKWDTSDASDADAASHEWRLTHRLHKAQTRQVCRRLDDCQPKPGTLGSGHGVLNDWILLFLTVARESA